jgi:hypothetical protein
MFIFFTVFDYHSVFIEACDSQLIDNQLATLVKGQCRNITLSEVFKFKADLGPPD